MRQTRRESNVSLAVVSRSGLSGLYLTSHLARHDGGGGELFYRM